MDELFSENSIAEATPSPTVIRTKDSFCYGDLVLNFLTQRVTRGGQRIKLHRMMYMTLLLLMENFDQVYSKQEIYDFAHDESLERRDVSGHTMQTNMHRLRLALGKPEVIRTYENGYYGLGATNTSSIPLESENLPRPKAARFHRLLNLDSRLLGLRP